MAAVLELKIDVHIAEEGGYWAEVVNMPGCITEGDTLEELEINLQEAIEGCLLAVIHNIKVEIKEIPNESTFRKSISIPYATERMDAIAC